MSKDLEAQRARAETKFKNLQLREAMAAQRVREEADRLTALDEKTAKLRALRLARDTITTPPAPSRKPSKH